MPNLIPQHLLNPLIRRGVDPSLMGQAPMLTQETSGSPLYDPQMVPNPAIPEPDRSPMAGINPNDVPQGVPQQEMAEKPSQADIIINALTKVLHSHTKKSEREHELAARFIESQLPQTGV